MQLRLTIPTPNRFREIQATVVELEDHIIRDLIASAERGDALAAHQLGQHFGDTNEFDEALRWFLLASEGGHAAAAVEAGILELRGPVSHPDPQRGLKHLRRAATSGDAEAQTQLAKLMLEGRWLHWDEDQLIDWVGRARAQGFSEALALDALFGAGQGMCAQLSSWFSPAAQAVTVLREQPLLAYVDHGLSAAACAALRERARPVLRPARVYSPATGERVRNLVRTNSVAHLGPVELLTLLVEWRILKHVDPAQPLARCEDMSVLHYAVGQQYWPHRDYLNPGQPEQFPPYGPGQRTRTVFAYLNTTLDGGETDFPMLGVRIQPSEGRVVVFDNVDANGRPDPTTLHAALPVIRGEKWLATLWLRENWAR